MASPVTALACNYNDQYVAAGTKSGQIFLLNNITKQVSAPLKAKTIQKHEVTGLKYSQLRKSRLASSSLSGSVGFWDCNSNAMVQQFVEHSAPCTGVALSPINETFAGSCGLDKKVVLYDIERASVISKNIKTEEPLTAIEIFPDGKTVAVGTCRGRILVYDMRNLSSPFLTKQAHNSAVGSILCQPPKDKLLSNSSSVLRSSKSRTRLLKENAVPASSSAPSIQTNAKTTANTLLSPNVTVSNSVTFANLSSNHQTPEIGRDSFSSQVFSPLRDQDFPSPMANLGGGCSSSSRRTSSVGSQDQSGIFSPLREQSFNSPALLKTPLGSLNSLSRTPMVSPLTIIREESPQKDITKRRSFFSEEEEEEEEDDVDHKNRLNNSVPRLAMLREDKEDNNEAGDKQEETVAPPSDGSTSMFARSNCGVVASTPFPQNQHARNINVNAINPPNLNYTSKTNVSSSVPKDSVSEIKAVMTAFPHALLESKAMDLAEERSGKDPSVSAAPQSGSGQEIGGTGRRQLTDFQQDFLRGCVEEAMDDFCSDMRKHLWHIQYDSIRAFQRQKEEVQGLLKHYVMNEQLVLENDRLRRENEELRRYF